MDAVEREYEEGDRDDHDPGALEELGQDHDDRDYAGGGGAEAVERGAGLPAGAVVALPVAHHAGLGERERGEDTDDVEVDQRVDVRLEGDDQCDRDGVRTKSRSSRRAGRRG